jgi:predicted HTH transcriptional regulator
VIAAITKPIEALTADDLRELINRKWPESENVEYKGELSRDRNNRPDPWYSGGSISDASKKKIFKELVAFANTSGGRLFLGISESQDRPPRADAINPLPRSAKLAEQIEQSIISSIDPPLTFLRVYPVVTEADGESGAVVIDVSASYSGPHRSTDRECYARKGTNSVPMRM